MIDRCSLLPVERGRWDADFQRRGSKESCSLTLPTPNFQKVSRISVHFIPEHCTNFENDTRSLLGLLNFALTPEIEQSSQGTGHRNHAKPPSPRSPSFLRSWGVRWSDGGCPMRRSLVRENYRLYPVLPIRSRRGKKTIKTRPASRFDCLWDSYCRKNCYQT